MAPPTRSTNQDAMLQMLQMMMADREAERAERQANIAALQQIAQNNQGHGNHDHPGSKLKNFQNTNPPMFNKTEEPLDADDGSTMENNLGCGSRSRKVPFATHYSGPAKAWWTSARAMNAGQMMTWEDFKLKFSKYHVPQGLIKKMRDEFRELKQGRMSVVEYRDSFLLKNYRPNYTNNNGGPPKPGGNNTSNHNNHPNNNNNNNNGNNNNTNTGPRTGSNAIPVTPKDKSTINCYECGVVGHYSNECPKKLAKIAANTAAPAQQQRRFVGRRNQNNNNGHFYHMAATEAQEAPQAMPRDAGTGQDATRPGRPVHARACTDQPRSAPERRLPPSALTSARPALSHPQPPRSQLPPGHGCLAPSTLYPSSRSTTIRHSDDGRGQPATMLDHLLLFRGLSDDRRDAVSTPLPSPTPLSLCSSIPTITRP
ncbi:hypothetical protein QYE76_058974 [Lolium multiflorum]|uniref:CCHC-type domain-containing protein n=1 Tax=Lolium multiflorum TaxID=4521 RepID=A0AAD8T838_LOLMU|nr:hypothetical protein QYE76_058974 [Lolium multiflorum]